MAQREDRAAAPAAAPAASPSEPALWRQFAAGGVGGAALVVVGHPLDTIKVKLQTMQLVPGEKPPYTGLVDCARKTMAKDGIRGLYRGMGAPLIGVTPMYALCFVGYGVGKKLFCDESSFSELKLHHIGLAGATSAVFTTPILAPLERIKCVLQVRGAELGKDATTMSVGKLMYKEGGLASVNRGFFGTMARDSVASVFYFATYEVLKRAFTPADSDGPGVFGVLAAGGFAGMFNWAAALPIDSLKSKLQVAPEGTYKHGMRSVFAEVMRTEGVLSLYRGLAPVMVRAFPANAACFAGFEFTLKGLEYMFPTK